VLACLQTLPQLKSHTAAALNVGVQPVEIREAIYQPAPFIGFPRTLNAIATANDVFQTQGIQPPLPVQGTVSDADRYPKGLAEQAPLYGTEIKDNLAGLSQPFNEALPRFLTEFCFGDLYTRGGLTLAQRELLVLCALATLGDTSARSPRPRVSAGGKLQRCGGRCARALLSLHRVSARRRRHPSSQKSLVSARCSSKGSPGARTQMRSGFSTRPGSESGSALNGGKSGASTLPQ
jgi:alkylhydroperoxidase/carboxymuconolactone decarboxylase family protein YurZ